MKSLILIVGLLFAQSLLADQFDGSVVNGRTRKYIYISKENRKYLLSGATPIISTYLTKLSEGDFLSIDATVNPSKTTMTVRSINYVGLRKLLGNWVGDDDRCYNFVTHTDFIVSKKFGVVCLDTMRTDYTYLINPNTDLWTMLVAGQYGSFIGDVNIIDDRNVQIDLYNSQTGEVERRLKLNRAPF